MKLLTIIYSFILLWNFVRADVSNRLEAGLSDNVGENQRLGLWCRITRSGSTIESCSWNTPDGHIYSVNSGIITDENGQLVAGVLPVPSDQNTCHIEVLRLTSSQLGTWSCKISMSEVNEYQIGFLDAITEPRVSDVRIPSSIINSIVPENYEVTLIPHIQEGDWEIEGHVNIKLSTIGQGDKIYLHAKTLVIFEDTILWQIVNDDTTTTELTIEGFGYDSNRDFFIIYLSENFLSGNTHTLSIKFSGILNDDLSGFYRSSYQNDDGITRYLATTQFQATDARKAFPCMDEPAIKSVFEVRLGHTLEYSTASNMRIVEANQTIDGNSQYLLDIYEPTPRMSTYLLAFLISDFTYRTSGNDIDFYIWARKDQYPNTEFASMIGPDILAHYEDYFALEFPLPKQSMAAIPDMSFGGMENWGLIMYRESVLLYENGVSSLQDKDRITEVVAHELAHMWFGDLVTMAWWSDLWLNEGFATFVATIGGDSVQPEFRQVQRSILTMNQIAYQLDALDSSHPVQATVNHPDEINEIFDDISYNKGAALIRMMSAFLGEDTFRKGVSNYLTAFQYSNTVTDDLFEYLTDAANEDGVLPADLTVKKIMDPWTLLKGFPELIITRDDPDTNPNQLTVTQSRLLIGESDPNDTNDYKWWIPISYSYAGGDFQDTTSKEWLSPDDDQLSFQLPSNFPDEPYILNVQGTGYYRVNYDTTNWKRLADKLINDLSSIDLLNRAQLIDDAFNLAKQGSLNYELALNQTEYLNQEEEYIPWSSSSSGFDYLILMIQRTTDFQFIQDYIIEKIQHIYENLGYHHSDNDSFYDILNRELSMSYLCGFEYQQCVDPATEEFEVWFNSDNPDDEASNPIDVGIRSIVYCTNVAVGDSETWQFFQQRFINSDNANEQETILYALGCSKDVETLQTYLDMTLDPNSMLSVTDGYDVVSSVASNPLGTSLAWEWMQTQWDEILAYYDTAVSSPVSRMVESVTRSFNTQQELDELQQFYNDNLNNLGTAQRATESAIINTQINLDWMTNYYNIVVNWLQNRK